MNDNNHIHRQESDAELIGTCDTCGTEYDTWSRDGRCGDCGECSYHCTHAERLPERINVITYLVTASVTIEIDSDAPMADGDIEEVAKNRFFAEIETYKKDEVRIEIVEEQENE